MTVGTGTSTIEKLDVVEDYRYDDGDEERFAHYVAEKFIVDASVTGTPLRAICGRVFVPQRDPKRFPVCADCKNIYDSLPAS